MSTDTDSQWAASDVDLPSLGDLISQTPGAHVISSADELRCGAFEAGEELDEFLAFVAGSRRAHVAIHRG